MHKKIPENYFDRSKPFYPLVVLYVTELVGLKDLLCRGLIGPTRFDNFLSSSLRNIVKETQDKDSPDFLVKIKKLQGPLELKSEFTGDSIEIDVNEIAKELVAEINYLAPYLLKSAGSLLILAHEISKDAEWHDQGPLWEFLRHLRNAAAHGGSFHFRGEEPVRLAQWGPFNIEKSLQGTPLFKNEENHGLLSPGDPVRLLWDIEQAYPRMRVEV